MKIKYEFVTGETVEIEVADNIGQMMVQIDRDIYRSNRCETNKHNSVESLAEKGIQFSDDSIDIPFFIEQQETRETLHNALDKLLPQQRDLVQKVFYEGRSMADIAREEGVTAKAVQDRVNKIKVRLRKIIEKN